MNKTPLFESIRLSDGNFDLIALHEARMKNAQKFFFGFSDDSFSLADFLNKSDFPKEGLFKCRLVYDSIYANPEFVPYVKRKINSLKTVQSNTIDYHFKSIDRLQINDLYSKKGQCDDILIVRNGLITDTSYCNIVFRKGNDWVTPENPLLAGVRRASLLHSGTIQTRRIELKTLTEFDSFSLINAMIPWEESALIPVENIL